MEYEDLQESPLDTGDLVLCVRWKYLMDDYTEKRTAYSPGNIYPVKKVYGEVYLDLHNDLSARWSGCHAIWSPVTDASFDVKELL